MYAGCSGPKAWHQDQVVVITVSGRGDKDLETVFDMGVVK